MDRKRDLVYSFSNGRTESSKELSMNEAKELIVYLKSPEENGRLVNRIWHLAYMSGIIQPGNSDDMAMNAASLDKFCINRGTVKKAINNQSISELKKTVKQFEAIYKKCVKKQDNIQMISGLEKQIKKHVELEEYESAAILKSKVDELKKENKSKKKRVII